MESLAGAKAQTWRGRIASQQAGGQSIRAWCRENNQAEHAFYWWRSRLGLSPKPLRRRQAERSAFAEVVVHRSGADRPAVAGDPIRVRLCGGRELVLPASMADERLAMLVHLIEGQS